MAIPQCEAVFETQLIRHHGPGSWVFVIVREGRTYLPGSSEEVRGDKDDGDVVHVELSYGVIYRD